MQFDIIPVINSKSRFMFTFIPRFKITILGLGVWIFAMVGQETCFRY